MIYFIYSPKQGAVKIGFTRSAGAIERLKGLQIGNPDDLIILRTMPGNLAEEERLHLLFAERRLRGEWFRADDDFLALIETLTSSCGPKQEKPASMKTISARANMVGRFSCAINYEARLPLTTGPIPLDHNGNPADAIPYGIWIGWLSCSGKWTRVCDGPSYRAAIHKLRRIHINSCCVCNYHGGITSGSAQPSFPLGPANCRWVAPWVETVAIPLKSLPMQEVQH